MLIILKVVRPTPPVEAGQRSQSGDQDSFVSKVTDLAVGMWRTALRPRPGWLRLCILLQVVAYTMYYISFGSGRLWYLYARKTQGWNQQEFIIARVVRKTVGITILLIVLPFLKRFNISDVNLLIAFNALHGLGFMVGSLSQFSVAFLLAGGRLRGNIAVTFSVQEFSGSPGTIQSTPWPDLC